MKKLISWNVNGLRACMTKGFEDFFREIDADIFCLQETKLQQGQIDFAPEGYNCCWNTPRRRDIRARQCLQRKSRCRFASASG